MASTSNTKGKEVHGNKSKINPKGSSNSLHQKKPNHYNRPNLGTCFRCGQTGHLSNECPQRRNLTIQEKQEEFNKEENDSDDIEYTNPDEGKELSCVLQRVLLTPITKTNPQRHAPFQAHCTINGKICNVIVDSGSSENMVSKMLVSALKLKVDSHPSPDKVG